MNLFTTIALETNSLCNRKCWFCPNAYNTRPNELMPLDLIEKVGEDLKRLKYQGRIVLYIYNEPLLDKRIDEIIYYLRQTVPKSCIMLATNADTVKSGDRFQQLFTMGLNQLQINVYSGMKRYRELLSMISETEAVEGNIYGNCSPRKRLYSIEQKFEKKITPDAQVGRFELSNRSGNVPRLAVPKEPLEKMCVRPFRSMQVNWKGEVILCCNDYHGDVICGNIATDPVDVIWTESKILRKYRQKLIFKDRSGLPLCAPCSFKGGAYPHMVPKFWPELLT